MPTDDAVAVVRDSEFNKSAPSVDLSSASVATAMLSEAGTYALPIRVSFIIPALNEEKNIVGCIKAIRSLQLPAVLNEIEIVVIDNCSTDRTADLSRHLGARVIEVPRKIRRQRETQAKASTGEWLAFVDADCGLAPDWLAICGGHLLGERAAVAVAGVMSAPSNDRTWVERAVYELSHGQNSADVRTVGWLPTFNLLVRRAAFESVGGFDESLTTCEDCDLGYKLAGLGRLLLDRRTSAAHYGESRTLGELFRREAWRSRGNLRLALTRPFDLSNWLSLLLPLLLFVGFIVAVLGLGAAALVGASLWPWLSGLGLVVVAVLALQIRKAGLFAPPSFVKQTVVLATYFSGRAVGLFWPFGRVNR